LIKSEIVAYLENFAIGEDVYTNNLSGPIMGTYEDASNPAFYIQSLTVGGSAAVYEVPMFSVIGTVAADITVNAT
jgi:hypothetical protein